jgi:hypothetical protein
LLRKENGGAIAENVLRKSSYLPLYYLHAIVHELHLPLPKEKAFGDIELVARESHVPKMGKLQEGV